MKRTSKPKPKKLTPIERERTCALEALAKEMTAMRDRLMAERDFLQKQITQGAPAPKQRKPRRAKPVGEGTQT